MGGPGCKKVSPCPEMGICRDYLSAIIFYQLSLSLKIVLDLSITDIAFAIYFVVADKLSR